MAFTPQNFRDGIGPVIAAAWLNGVDQLVNNVFAGASTQTQALAALFTPQPTNTAMSNGAPQLFGTQVGTAGSPSANVQPLLSFTQYLNASAGPNNFAGGAAWFSVYVEGGTQWAKGSTGYAQIDGGTGINAIGAMGFGVASATSNGNLIWGGWSMGQDLATAVQNQCFGHEIDIVIAAPRTRVTGGVGLNSAGCLWLANQGDELGNNHATFGLGIYGEFNARGLGFRSQFFSGILGTQNCIVPGNGNEFMQINGGTTVPLSYTGIRMLQQMQLGIDLSAATFNGGYAIFLPNGGNGQNGIIGAEDSGGAANYSLLYLNAAAPNALVIGQGVPGAIVLDNATISLPLVAHTSTAPGAGGGGALPATPFGYYTITIAGRASQVPYY